MEVFNRLLKEIGDLKMKEYVVSVSLKWKENDIRDSLEDDESYPTDEQIEEWMIDEMREGIDESAAEFKIVEEEEQ